MADNKERVQAHGMTGTQLKDLQNKQQDGTTGLVKANKDSQYEIPEHEQHLIHIYLQMPGTDDTTGAFTTVPRIVPYHVREFERAEAKGNFGGYAIAKIIHDPRTANQRKKAEKTAALESPVENHRIDKPLEQMDKKELQAVYMGLYKEEPAKTMNEAMLIEAINEKEVFLTDEAADAEKLRIQEEELKNATKPPKK